MTVVDQSLRKLAGQRMNEGVRELDHGDLKDAVTILKEASLIDPSYFGPWFNLGLAYKRQRDWTNALDVFLRAWRRLPPDAATGLYASVLWNVGIAASVIESWLYAHEAWKPLHGATGRIDQPPSIPMGLAWVSRDTLPPVLVRRLDPVRAVVIAGDPGDALLQPGVVVVHDGARLGAKAHGNDQLPIFPVLHVASVGGSPAQAFEQFQLGTTPSS